MLVFEVDNVDGAEEGMIYHGYFIVLPIDARWISEDSTEEAVKARVSLQNQIHIRYHAWPFSMVNSREEMDDQVDDRCTVGMDAAINDFLKKPGACKWKNLFLDFPQGHDFSTKALNQHAGEENELELELIELDGDGEQTGKHTFACWKVARVDKSPRKKGRMEQKEKKSKAAQLLEKKRAKMNKG